MTRQRASFIGLLFLCTTTSALAPLYAATPDSGPKPAIRAKPAGDPGQWITSDDYPTSALMDSTAGRTAVKLDVDETGRVVHCLVTRSSGSDPLDEAACALLSQRARFIAAKDDRGRSMADEFTTAVTWQIPDPKPLSISDYPQRLKMEMDVDEEGAIQTCLVIENTVNKTPAGTAFPDPCEAAKRSNHPTPVLDRDGKPIPARIIYSSQVDVQAKANN